MKTEEGSAAAGCSPSSTTTQPGYHTPRPTSKDRTAPPIIAAVSAPPAAALPATAQAAAAPENALEPQGWGVGIKGD
eukprot:6971234-Prorocentrum_lima.AAC.1